MSDHIEDYRRGMDLAADLVAAAESKAQGAIPIHQRALVELCLRLADHTPASVEEVHAAILLLRGLVLCFLEPRSGMKAEALLAAVTANLEQHGDVLPNTIGLFLSVESFVRNSEICNRIAKTILCGMVPMDRVLH